MSKPSVKKEIPPCGCQNCHYSRGPRCRCHDNNALLALILWDFGRMIRHHRGR